MTFPPESRDTRDSLAGIQHAILVALARDARVTNTDLARQLHVSRPTLSAHLKRLKRPRPVRPIPPPGIQGDGLRAAGRRGDEESLLPTDPNAPVIQGYSAIVDMLKLNSRLFFLEIKTNPAEPRIIDALRRIPQVLSIDGIVGEYSLWVKVSVRDQSEFSTVLSKVDQVLGSTIFQRYRVVEVLVPFKEFGEVFPVRQDDLAVKLDDLSWRVIGTLGHFASRKFRRDVVRALHAKSATTDATTDAATDATTENAGDAASRAATVHHDSGAVPHWSASTITKRLRQLERAGFIRRYVVSVHPRYAREPTKFILRLKPRDLSRYEYLAREVLGCIPEITGLYRTGEDYGLLATVRVRDIPAYKRLIARIYATDEILDTHTTLVIDEVVPSIVPYTINPC